LTFTGAHAIAHGDVLATLKELPDNEFDAAFCDPPYGFRFMGKKWDYSVPSVEVWRELLRVLKPGAPLLSFGGSRTYHRIAIGIEDAGFELRDSLMWLYGKGFPKSLNVGKALASQWMGVVPPLAQQWDGFGTALKPAFEPIVLARKPMDGTVAENVTRWGTGALAIDACRIDAGARPLIASKAEQSVNAFGNGLNGSRAAGSTDEGRWPANLILDEHAGEILDASVAPTKSVPFGKGKDRDQDNVAHGAVLPMTKRTAGGYADAGGPSRFFYCAKVSTKEREHGCAALPAKSAGEATERNDACSECGGSGEWITGDGGFGVGQPGPHGHTAICPSCNGTGRAAGLDNPRAGAGRTGGARNHHPTLKPLSLNRWLATLIKPPTENATLLIPYSGAGSEIIGALQAGWPFVFGIEGEAEYIAIAEARIEAWRKG